MSPPSGHRARTTHIPPTRNRPDESSLGPTNVALSQGRAGARRHGRCKSPTAHVKRCGHAGFKPVPLPSLVINYSFHQSSACLLLNTNNLEYSVTCLTRYLTSKFANMLLRRDAGPEIPPLYRQPSRSPWLRHSPPPPPPAAVRAALPSGRPYCQRASRPGRLDANCQPSARRPSLG